MLRLWLRCTDDSGSRQRSVIGSLASFLVSAPNSTQFHHLGRGAGCRATRAKLQYPNNFSHPDCA